MSPIKQQIFDIVNSVEDKKTLQQVYEILYNITSIQESSLIDSLSPKQKEELYQSYEESKNPENLIPNKEVVNRMGKWLEG